VTDRNMCSIEGSPRWREERGLMGVALEGRYLFDIFPAARERWAEIYARVLEGETIRGPKIDLRMPDGRLMWMRVELTPWRDATGEIGGMLMMSVDISDVVEALEASRRSEQRLKLAMEIGELNLWEVDFERQEVAQEGWENSGFDATHMRYETMSGDAIWDTIHPHDRPAAQALWARHEAEGAPFRATYRMLQQNGPHI